MTTKTKIDRPVSIAVNELYEGKIKIIQNDASAKEQDEAWENIEM